MNINTATLEKAINYKFKNIALLKEALSHPSLRQHDRIAPDYERMELLGDALLGFLITEIIFNNFYNYEEGVLSKIKSYFVSKDILVKVARKLELAKYIIMTSGEEKSGGRLNDHNIENAMEALLAAIYLDSNVNQVKSVVHNLWDEYIDGEIDFDSLDPKSALQEFLQNAKHTLPHYQLINKTGPVHAPFFTIELSAAEHTQIAHGHSIKEAEKEAARLLIRKLKN